MEQATTDATVEAPEGKSAAAPFAAKGKFFCRGGEKFFLKGVSYGPFAPAPHGSQFPPVEMVRRDFALMRELGANCLRTFTTPPTWLLDIAAEHGLVVMAGLPWAEHICFLDDKAVEEEIRQVVANSVRSCERHPAIFAYLIGNEIPSDIVRWLGPERVGAFLKELYDLVKSLHMDALVSYANYPPTEYLDLDFLDFLSFNVYLHREHDFRRYLSRLQSLAENRPLVLTEFGIDSMREGADGQAAILDWQVRAAFETGVAGTTVFSWTDDWFTGGFQIENWAFGLVDRERGYKPAFTSVQKIYLGPVPPPVPNPPMISVVICAFNAERTMDDCLKSLRTLTYPNYEVIVVNDGSTDRTLEISQGYPEARIISQENRGLSVARNVGIEAAKGEIVAFTDSDCVVDPDWLTYLAYRFVHDGFAAVGGPNLPPPEDSLISACVAASPGGPTHVLLNDEVAEHVPGCNMAFRREVLREINGFDPVFRAAGDDVDLCWRLQNQGYPIGFSPAAMVWHYRRNTVKAYLKQQMGYGKAEAQLYFKHPYRFNLLGQSKWLGRIYGDLAQGMFSGKPVIYYGTFGRSMFQTLYEAPTSVLSFLPFTLEWNIVAVVLLIGGLVGGHYTILGGLPLMVSICSAVATAWRAKVEPCYDSRIGRLLIAALTYLGPLVRSVQRYLWRLRGMAEVERITFEESIQKPRVEWFGRRFYLSFWSEQGREKEDLLQSVIDFLGPRKYLIAIDQGWNDWDIEVQQGVWSRASMKVAVENHGGEKRFFRVRCNVRLSLVARLALGLCAGLAVVGAVLHLPEIVMVAVLMEVLSVIVAARQSLRLGRIMYHVVGIMAQRIQLTAVEGGAAAAAA